jgi:molybdopterin converting factor small subunit
MPRVLTELTRCERSVNLEIQAEHATVATVLSELVRLHPALAMHLYDETGGLRRHVLCFYNAVQADARARLDQPVTSGDSITLVNSVAGG